MKRHKFSVRLRPLAIMMRLFLAPIILLAVTPVAYPANENGDIRTPAPKGLRSLGIRAAAAARTSPFDPPTTDVFVTDGGTGLDSGCTFNNDSNHPLVISIVIDKFVGDVDANGYLINPAPLVSGGIIPASIDVIMPAYDVDVNGSPPPESDQVFFNGQSLGFLTGDNNIWKLNSFSIDVRKVKFPSRPASGGNVIPVTNKVQINIDTLSSGRWCTAIDWVALVIPVRPKFALDMSVIDGNKIRQNTGSATIDTIYEQKFDAACNVTTTKGPIDEYPFSGPATSGLFGWFSGEAKLRAKLKTCPENSIDPPEVKTDWTVNGGPAGTNAWTGLEGDVTVKMPSNVGSYTVNFNYTVNAKEKITATRKLFVTKASPITSGFPRRSWYEKATAWASGQSDDSAVIKGILDGLYGFGRSHWLYGYRFGAIEKCAWEDLVSDSSACNYSDCYVFSDVLENMAATLGVGGLSPVKVEGSSGQGFLTSGAPSLDPAFRGSAKPLGGAAYDRYLFSSHSLRQRAGSSVYYDATFDGIYGNETQFIAYNLTGKVSTDAGGRDYGETSEGVRVYELPGSSYDSWGSYEYALPTTTKSAAARLLRVAAASASMQFPGTPSYSLIDTNKDGIYDGLEATVSVLAPTAGTYSIKGRLEQSGNLVANRPANESQQFSRVSFQANAPGVFNVKLSFSGEQIYQSGLDGPYDLVLDGISVSGNTKATLQTPAYDHRSFGEIPSTITGVGDEGADDNHDGKFEGIRANVDVNARAAGNYRLAGSLLKDGVTLVSASADVNLTAGQKSVPFLFLGLPLKRSAQDGPYEGAIALVDSNGHTVTSFDFLTQPYKSSAFASVIDLDGSFVEQGIDSNANSLFDTLSVTFGASFSNGGTYLLTGTLGTESGSKTVFNEQLVTVVSGTQQLTLNFAGPDIYGLQMDGPYRVEVSLRDPSTQQVIDRVALPQTTKSYHYTDFDPNRNASAISLTGASNDRGVDTDGNGAFNQLQVGVAVQLKDSGTYEWSARLVDLRGTEIGFYTRRASLSAGNNQIDFIFDGIKIGKNGKDGPYFVKSLLMFGTSTNLVATDVAITTAYKAKEFEGYVQKLPGDLNGDGKVDQADITLLQQGLGSVIGNLKYNPDADLDGDGRITIADLRILRDLMKTPKA